AFRTLPVERAVEYALGHARIDYHSRSDFGYAFARFCRESVDHLDRKTTLLVLGDARNNYNDPQPWTLRLMRERVKGIIWLDPERAEGPGDCQRRREDGAEPFRQEPLAEPGRDGDPRIGEEVGRPHGSALGDRPPRDADPCGEALADPCRFVSRAGRGHADES